jgi:hypothetical protein
MFNWLYFVWLISLIEPREATYSHILTSLCYMFLNMHSLVHIRSALQRMPCSARLFRIQGVIWSNVAFIAAIVTGSLSFLEEYARIVI